MRNDNNSTLNTSICVQMTENSNINFTESLENHTNNKVIEDLNSNLAYENSIHIPMEKEKNVHDNDTIPIYKENDENESTNDEDDKYQVSIYETENHNENNSSLLNEPSFTEKSIDLKNTINKETETDNNFKQNENKSQLKSNSSHKTSSSKSNRSSLSGNNCNKTLPSRSENDNNGKFIAFTDNDESINNSINDTSSKQFNPIKKKSRDASLNSKNSSIKSSSNNQKKIRKNEIKIKKSMSKNKNTLEHEKLPSNADNKTDSIIISENDDEEQDPTYIKIPGNILMSQSPTPFSENDNLNSSKQPDDDKNMDIASFHENLMNSIHKEKDMEGEIEEEQVMIKDKHKNHSIIIGNENEHLLLSENIKNKSKEKREFIYNTINSLSEISDTIDAVEKNIKDLNEEIIQAPNIQPKFPLQKTKSDSTINDIDQYPSLIIRSNEDIQYTILSITNSLREIQSQTIQEMIESSHFLHPIVSSLKSIITYSKHLLKILNTFIEKKMMQKEKHKLIKARSEQDIYRTASDLLLKENSNKESPNKQNHLHHHHHHQKEEDNKTTSSSSNHHVKKKHHKLEKYKFYKSQINVLLEVMESMINSYYTYMEKIEQDE